MIYLGWILVATELGEILYINHYSVPFFLYKCIGRNSLVGQNSD